MEELCGADKVLLEDLRERFPTEIHCVHDEEKKVENERQFMAIYYQ